MDYLHQRPDVAGRGEAFRRPDGRLFLSIDTWDQADFALLAADMLPKLPRPLYTVVDEADTELRSCWESAGFTPRRREWEYVVPTAPGTVPDVPGVTIGPPSDEPALRSLDDAIRAEVSATVGWPEMPAEILPRPDVLDLTKYTVAAAEDGYVGLLRLAAVPRQPRIGLLAVRANRQRAGIGRALLTHVLDVLHRKGVQAATAEVSEANPAAVALVEGAGARRVGGNVELVLR
ncbi:ribosomal-protein-alanine N-acetyltransferase [Amycolatopsis mediterranei S699]|uniref:Ribosomal-protein-alanine N-acetyltransferase n=2 Tax=Amycolatopsis mediterranei TaxID=33910 RepID=A0A0H3DF48_AMYMU|nr:GNAT family N-acetyltransferase [Amycolatopsis mediterranei]ADJ48728.1 ribosomal-protein-alanine N-acetyltransferase [Amycolatopsis mediterranei U32]AEK45664.1 ribosomal-protein-alanine N-acetyltransferase [Amycolatopsis mediterranei S699]AFO80437.1 ribosomal-protein-alanine N-acetyltransferase [Amycolatopsis mediterranei S699]AGT87565.1 ribosomal-protein-alanine N-acetyltransferase [Amycolatopsis mediterranei RB]KDO03944.1 GCN5 family acetyltransferase [Amycolatopsis mediterranei]